MEIGGDCDNPLAEITEQEGDLGRGGAAPVELNGENGGEEGGVQESDDVQEPEPAEALRIGKPEIRSNSALSISICLSFSATSSGDKCEARIFDTCFRSCEMVKLSSFAFASDRSSSSAN